MYAQINYGQKLGTGPASQLATIAQAGCFLTAFCNLLQRFGENIDPPTLNNYFIQHGTFLSENASIRDLLAWASVSAYDSQVTTVGTGGPGWPNSNDAIVKFVYGRGLTHFCLVADWTQGTIVDSWDGVVKRSPYGTPVAWATYQRHTAQVVVHTVAPETSPAYTVEPIAPRTEELKVNTHLWNLTERSWPGLVNNPVSEATQGTTFTAVAIAHHILGGSYYMHDTNIAQGYNIVDCEVAPTPVAPAPVPAPVASVPVAPAPPTGATPYPSQSETYTVIVDLPGYTTSNLAVNRANPTGTVKAGEYHVFNKRFSTTDAGKLIAINVTSKPGTPGSWINPDDNHKPVTVPSAGFVQPREASVPETPPEPEPAPAPAPTPSPAPVESDSDIHASYRPFMPDNSAIDCIVLKPTLVTDRIHFGKEIPVAKDQFVRVYGTFQQGGRTYALLKLKTDIHNYYMYGIPVASHDNLGPYLDPIFSVTDHIKYGWEKFFDKTFQTIDGIFKAKAKK